MSNDWQNDGVYLKKVFTSKDFDSAFKCAEQVAQVAREMDHHPEIRISWGKCEILLTSHDAQGVTERDFLLSKKIDSILTDV